MNTFTAVITTATLVLAEVNDSGLTSQLIAEEPRPESFAAADTALAAHGYARTEAWDLTGAGVIATVEVVDNMFNGIRAARLDQAVGTTHDEFEPVLATSLRDGDLITDQDRSAIYVVAGSSLESGAMKVHAVGEGKTWEDRYTSTFSGVVWAARKR
jgi:hypothetical protein